MGHKGTSYPSSEDIRCYPEHKLERFLSTRELKTMGEAMTAHEKDGELTAMLSPPFGFFC